MSAAAAVRRAGDNVTESLVLSFVGFPIEMPQDERSELARRVAAHCNETGDCVWHGASIVLGTDCWCADCRPSISKLWGGR